MLEKPFQHTDPDSLHFNKSTPRECQGVKARTKQHTPSGVLKYIYHKPNEEFIFRLLMNGLILNETGKA